MMVIPRVFIIWDSKIGSDPGAKAVGPAPNHLDNLRLAFEGRADVVVLGLPRDAAQG